MKKNFGSFYYCANFFDRIVSKSACSPSDAITAFHIASLLLKKFDALQEKNPLVTLSFATDSLRVYYRGQLQFHIQPRKYRTIIWIPGGYSRNLSQEIQKHPHLFPVEGEHISWVLNEEGVDWLMKYLRSNWQPSTVESKESIAHSRHIPGEVRQAILTEFLTSGRWCSGVAGITKRHKVSETMRIEFDHILPHSVGGSNGYWNIQILCSDCNQVKRATAT
ncbi:HNH endonuclease [Nitrosomonas sp. Nm166]|uniref:HNH endonuclease n=1 Tax=Nitrosomonas sp. Nm166 TaxID=1881054 RepID=UPI0008EAA87B|nr:HNH endonuclease [Nitrosomonas sp. Nm166]SFE51798.1 HNH endonuclease [Nitrosomonas sp. Nm166]